MREVSPGKLGTVYGLDLGTRFSTQQQTALPIATLLFAFAIGPEAVATAVFTTAGVSVGAFALLSFFRVEIPWRVRGRWDLAAVLRRLRIVSGCTLVLIAVAVAA